VADASSVAYDALKMAVEHVLSKIREGKKLSTEDVLVLYLGTRIDDVSSRFRRECDETKQANSRRGLTSWRGVSPPESTRQTKESDDLAKRIDAVQTTLLEIQKLLLKLVKTRQSAP
jgi:hypothetical protein